jgi:hypothetical protein
MPFLCPVQCYFISSPKGVPLKEQSSLIRPLDEASLGWGPTYEASYERGVPVRSIP